MSRRSAHPAAILAAALAVAVLLARCGGGASGDPQYFVGGTLAGLPAGNTLTLTDNGGDDLALSANGPFVFATPLPANTAYTVTVLTPPASGPCAVINGAGTATGASAGNVQVSCDTVTTFAGSGAAGAAGGAAATFSAPGGIVADDLGNVYVADSGNNKLGKILP